MALPASAVQLQVSHYSEHARPAGLERWVDAFWSLDGAGEVRRIMPDGCIDFIFDLERGTARVVGTMSASQLVRTRAGARAFGVRFAPGAAAALLDLHAHELTDGDASLPDVTRAARFALAERIAGARDHGERVHVMGEFLREVNARLRPLDARVWRAAQALRASAGTRTIASVANEVGVSERQLERLFREHIGARPKLFARVMRMQRVLLALERSRESQAVQASAAGYADEAHLVHDFKALAGLTPQQLLAERRVGFLQGDRPVRR